MSKASKTATSNAISTACAEREQVSQLGEAVQTALTNVHAKATETLERLRKRVGREPLQLVRAKK